MITYGSAGDSDVRAQLSKWQHAAPSLKFNGRYHSFNFDESSLPPRIQPTQTGQMVAVVDDPKFRREDAYFIADLGSKALIALFHPNENPAPELLVLVDRKHLMCIHDFYQESEYRRINRGYQQKKEELITYALKQLEEGRSRNLPQGAVKALPAAGTD